MYDTFQLSLRRTLIAHISDGDIPPALKLADRLLDKSPVSSTLSDLYPLTYARLLCQHFVELLRKNEVEALTYAQNHIAPFSKRHEDAVLLMRKYLPLLAYPQLELSPLFDLMDVKHRDALANDVNGCVMAWLRGDDVSAVLSTLSPLERILRHLVIVMCKVKGDSWSLQQVLEFKMDTSS